MRLSALLLLAVPMYSVVKEARICIKDPSAVPRHALYIAAAYKTSKKTVPSDLTLLEGRLFAMKNYI